MPAHSQQFIRKTVLISLSTIIILGSASLSLSILGNLYSQVITNLIYGYNAVIQQQSPMP